MIDCHGERGNCFGIIHENITSSDIDIHSLSHVLDEMSIASIIDDKIYNGNWDLVNLFNVFGYVIPCTYINGSVKTDFTASLWTKFLNECMRKKRIRDSRIHIDKLWLLKEYAVNGMNPEDLSNTHLDLLKFVDFKENLKPRVIQRLKKLQKHKT